MPLRPELYRRLAARREFGGVIIAHAGEAMNANVERDALTGRPRLVIRSPGEYYRINCPYCNDTRHRLWVNHMWARYDPRTRGDNLWLCCCYNEGCLSSHARRLDLRNRVFDDFGYGRIEDPVQPGEVLPGVLPAAKLPGPVLPLGQLAPDHAACQFLRGRGFDPVELSRHLGVSYCDWAQPWFAPTKERIIIPIYVGGEMKGWQARYVGEPPGKHVPKYYTLPGMKKRAVLYNLDLAKRSPFVVACEGPTDVWRVGHQAVALLGKKASPVQKHLLGAHWGGGAAVVLLDGDAADEAQELYDGLAGLVRHRVVVRLPPGTDPADCARADLGGLILAAAREQGVDLPALRQG